MNILVVLVFIGLLILQIVMIVKFFQIASDVRRLRKKQDVDVESLPQLRQRIELEKYLGHSEQAKESIVRARINIQNKYEALRREGFSAKTLEPTVEYLNAELQKCGIDPKDLLASVMASETKNGIETGALVVEKATGNQWVVIFNTDLDLVRCRAAGGIVEKWIDKKDIMPFEEYKNIKR